MEKLIRLSMRARQNLEAVVTNMAPTTWWYALLINYIGTPLIISVLAVWAFLPIPFKWEVALPMVIAPVLLFEMIVGIEFTLRKIYSIYKFCRTGSG